jgi:hypothetical protein
MAGGMGAGAGIGIMGGILGGIGDIISSQNYKRPHLAEATGYEKRLRDLAQSQLLAGGQQTLGGTALYNQMVPMLMGMLPGMKYHPGTSGEAGGAGGSAGGGGATGPLASYQDALKNYQQQVALAQQRTALRAKMKGGKMKGPGHLQGPARKDLKNQLRDINQQIASQPTQAQRERQMYTAGVQPANTDIYNIRTAEPGSAESSLAAIQGMMDAIHHGQPKTDLSSIYQGAGGY